MTNNYKFSKKQIKEFKNDRTIKGFKIIQDKYDSDNIDTDDSNSHTVVIKEITTDKYYSFSYEEWIGTDDPVDYIDEEAVEVFPKQITVTIYE